MPARRPRTTQPARRSKRLLALRSRLPREHGVLHGLRGSKRHPLSKNPLWARAGGHTVGGALPGGRLTRGVGIVVLLGLTGLSVRYFIGQKLDLAGQIERAARRQYIPQLERQLGTTIEVGSFDTDLLGRVVIRDIVIGRDARLPLGALAQARSITVGVDIVGLALRRVQPLNAVQAVTIDQPQVYLERERNGLLNLQRFIKSRPGRPPFQWTGTIFVRGGRTYYFDNVLRSTRGIPLEVDARGINGAVRFAGKAPLRWNGTVAQALLPRERVGARDFVSNGAYDLATKRAVVTVDGPPIPAPLAAQYVFRKKEIIIDTGTIGGHIVLGVEGKRVAPRGDVVLRNVSGSIPTLREPRDGRPKAGPIIQLDKVDGPLRFVGTALESRRLLVHAFDADWQVGGQISLGNVKPGQPVNPLFDVTVSTRRVPLVRLRPWAPRQLPGEISTDTAQVTAQVSGSATNVRASGTAQAGPTKLVSTQPRVRVSATAPFLRGVWAVAYVAGQPTRFAFRAQVPTALADGVIPISGVDQNAKARARDLQLTVRGATLNAPLQVTAQSPSWQVSSPRYGVTNGRDLRVDTFKPAQVTRWQGAFSFTGATTSGLNREGISPAFARFVRESGTATAKGTFAEAGSPRPRVQADVSLSSVSFDREAIPATIRQRLGTQLDQTLRLSALRGQLGVENGQFALTGAQASSPFGILRGAATRDRVALQVPDFRLPARQINDILSGQRLATSGDWRGRLAVSARPGARNFDAQFALYSPRVALGTARADGTLASSTALLDAPRLQGTARLGDDGAWRANAQITLSEGLIRSGRLGTTSLRLPAGINGTRLRNAAVTFAASPTGWSARINGSRLAVPVQGQVLTLESIALVAQNGPGTPRNDDNFAAQFSDIQLTRISATWGNSGQFDGTARLQRGAIQARLLAREVEADAVQRLLAVASRRNGRLTGRFNALVQIEPNQNPRFEVQMRRGAAFLPAQNLSVPLSDVIARGDVQPEGANVLRLTEFSGWSDGAHLSASGNVGLRPPRGGALPSGKGTLQFTGLRLNRLPLTRETRQGAAPDGIVNGEFNWQLGNEPQIEGSASLSGTTVGGIAVEKAEGQVFLARDEDGVRVRLERWNGTIEDAAFKAELEADTNQNFWRLRFSTPQIASRRLARVGARTVKRPDGPANPLEGAIPIEGDIFADIDVNGTLRPLSNEENNLKALLRPIWMPREGYATIKAPSLTWRGRPLGALRADLSFEDTFARVRTLELVPDAPADAPSTSPRITLTGKLPLLPNQTGLDASLQVGEAPLQWFFDSIRDGREILQRNRIQVPALDQVVNSLDALPDGVRGRIALDATLAGSWTAPTIAVPRLTLRDGRAPLPQGGFSPPATLDTSFAVAGGALTLGTTEIRLEKTPAERESDEDDDPALLTVASGGSVDPKGDINLRADIYNANLSQLATWIPALKNAQGAPTLRGTLSGFSLAVSGKTIDPMIVGSIQGENLTYNNYTIDRLLVSRFEVGNGRAQIEPGNLTIAKGAFQSSAAWGRIGWDWSRRGFSPDAPLELHFPLQTRDFGALSGVFVTGLSDVQASEFQGSIDIGGSVAKPVFTGQVKIKDGKLRYASPRAPFPVGITDLNGSLRFEDNNRLVIDADDPLRGRFANAASVASQRKKDAKRPKGGVTVKQTAAEKAAAQATVEAAKNLGNSSVQLAGKWKLQGDITLSDLSPSALANPARGIGRQKFNLALSLDDGSYTASDFAGVRDVAFAARWQTDDGGAQRVRWMLAARGTKDAKKGKNAGQAFGIGSFRLASNFASSLDGLFSSKAEEFTSADDFKEFPVASRFALTALPDRRTQISLQNFGWSVTGAGNGEIDGRVVLDDREAIQKPPQDAAISQKVALNPTDKVPSLQEQLKLDRSHSLSFFGPRSEFQSSDDDRLAQRSNNEDDEPLEDDTSPNRSIGSLRIGGTLTLQNTEIYGAPTGGGGAVTRLSFLPPAPRFDVRLKLGRNVQFISSALRTQLQGELVASGTPNNPLVRGTVETREGQVRFPNARARVEEGRLVILVSRDATTDLLQTRVDVDVTARGDAGISQVVSNTGNSSSSRPQYQRYQITLRIRGPIILGAENNQENQNLSIDVTSNPPLSQGDALAQLLGISVRGDNNTGNINSGDANQAYARAVLQLVSAPLFSGVERSVAQALGLDNVGFEYRFNEPLAVQFSKALGDRIYVTYRRSLGNNGAYNGARTPFELRIDYRLKGNLLLGLRLNEQNISTLSLLKSWRF